MLHRSLVLAALIATLPACKAKPSGEAAKTGAGATAPADAGAAATAGGADAAPAKPAKAAKAAQVKAPPPTKLGKEVRAAYQQHLRAGRKAAKAAQWADAIKEFDQALTAIPGDDRALGELSWAAFSAGDFDRARKAGRASVLAATDPKVKAASLYNLGRAEEASNKPAEAAALYKESIALRPNKTVSDRLAGLGKDVAAAPAPDAMPCAGPMAEAALCPCLIATVDADAVEDKAALSCELSTAGADDFQVVTYQTSDLGEHSVALVARQAKGWAVVGRLTDIYNPGMMGISEEWELTSTDEQTLGGKQVVSFKVTKNRTDSDMGVDEVESETHESLLVCVRGTPTTCPLDVTTGFTYARERLGLAEDAEMSDVADLRTKGLPIRTETKLSVELGADGVAKVRAIAGKVAADTVGDHRLW